MADYKRAVSDRLTQRQESSEARRQYLQRLARLMCSSANPAVQFVRGITTARCRKDGTDLLIEVGAKAIDQTVTDLPRKMWSLVAQEGLIVHEIGHVLFTDFEAHETIAETMTDREMSAFHDIVFNPAEDAAIEEQLRQSFDCADELDAYNANLFERQKENAEYLRLTQAVKVAILEKGCYDAGAVREYRAGERQLVNRQKEPAFDRMLDEVDDLLADVMTEPAPQKRYDRMLEFWQTLKDVMDDQTQTDPVSENNESGREGYEGKPDDSSGMTQGQDADELAELDPDEVEEQVKERGQPDEVENDEAGDGESGESGRDASGGIGEGGENGEGSEAEEEPTDGGAGGESGDGSSEGDESGDGNSSPDGDGSGETGGENGDDGGEADGEAGNEGESGGDGGGESSGDGAGGGDITEGGDGPQSGDGDGHPFPGHEGHHLVVRD